MKKKKYYRTCKFCGVGFTARHQATLFCSDKCKKEHGLEQTAKVNVAKNAEADDASLIISFITFPFKVTFNILLFIFSSKTRAMYFERRRWRQSYKQYSSKKNKQVATVYIYSQKGLSTKDISRLSGIRVGKVERIAEDLGFRERKKRRWYKGNAYVNAFKGRNDSDNFTMAEQTKLFTFYGGICQYCFKPIGDERWCIHHLIPVYIDSSKSRQLSNGKLMHKRCHLENFRELHFEPFTLRKVN